MDATIKEGNVGRSFSPVDKLKINLQDDGGESLWVPEDSVQLDELYTSTNGTYYAAPRDIYGWGVVTVDVDNSIDEPDDLYDDDEDQEEEPEGNWYFIDPDTDDRVDIEEDENGWYFIDPDTGDRVDIEEDDDGWCFIDPDTGERVDIEEDDDGDPYFIDPDTGERVDIDWDEEDEEDEDDDWGDDDEDWDEEGDDEDDGITDGDDYDYLDDDGNLVEEECPASIKIMHVPGKTSYYNGERIDLDGLVIQAFDTEGNPWQSSRYPNGYIPAHEIDLSQPTADYSGGTTDYNIPEYSDNITSVTSIGSAVEAFDKINDAIHEAAEASDSKLADLTDMEIRNKFRQQEGSSVCILYPHTPPSDFSGGGFTGRFTIGFIFDELPNSIVPSQSYPGTYIGIRYYWGKDQDGNSFVKIVEDEWRGYANLFCGEKDGAISTANMTEKTGEKTNEIFVDWTSPCFQQFSETFTISVAEDHGGSHYSGKF